MSDCLCIHVLSDPGGEHLYSVICPEHLALMNDPKTAKRVIPTMPLTFTNTEQNHG